MRTPRRLLAVCRPRVSLTAALVGAVAVVAVATIAVGAALVLGGRDIGAPLPPTLFRFRPLLGPLAPLAAALLALGVLGASALRRPLVRPLTFALGAPALALVLRLSLNAARAGPVDWWIFFDPRFGEGTVEYLAALPALASGPLIFLDRFAEIASSLPVHAAGHPPGLLTLVALLGITTAPELAALVIGVGVVGIPLVYVLGRELLEGEEEARAATLLSVFAPSGLFYGASAADALFATLAVLAAVALVSHRSRVRLVVGPAALAVSSFFSYATLAVGAWAAVIAWLREGGRAALRLALAAAAGLVAFYLLLYALTGFDVVGALVVTHDVYRVSIARIRPYAYFVFGAPVAWMLALGPPIVVLWLRSLAARRPPALALAAVVAASAVGGFTKGETERIWLFLVPLACVAAAAGLPRRWLVPVLGALAVQAFLMEVLLGTVW
jgi:methylthioxylose transferase